MKTYKILCKCTHKFQDETYGKQTRIANQTNKKYPSGHVDVRCTVCNTIHNVKEQ